MQTKEVKRCHLSIITIIFFCRLISLKVMYVSFWCFWYNFISLVKGLQPRFYDGDSSTAIIARSCLCPRVRIVELWMSDCETARTLNQSFQRYLDIIVRLYNYIHTIAMSWTMQRPVYMHQIASMITHKPQLCSARVDGGGSTPTSSTWTPHFTKTTYRRVREGKDGEDPHFLFWQLKHCNCVIDLQ